MRRNKKIKFLVPDFWNSEKSRMKNDMNEHDDFWPDFGRFSPFEQDINLFQSPNRLSAPAKRNLQARLFDGVITGRPELYYVWSSGLWIFLSLIKIQLSPVIQMRLRYRFQNVHSKVSTLIGQKLTWPDPTRLPNWMAMIWIHVQVLKMATKLYSGIVIQIILIKIHMNPLCDRETFPFEPKWTILKHSRWY